MLRAKNQKAQKRDPQAFSELPLDSRTLMSYLDAKLKESENEGAVDQSEVAERFGWDEERTKAAVEAAKDYLDTDAQGSSSQAKKLTARVQAPKPAQQQQQDQQSQSDEPDLKPKNRG